MQTNHPTHPDNSTKKPRRGLMLVYTGDGKGKTTSALGLVVRAAGHNYKSKIYQFIKSPDRTYGEKEMLAKLDIEMIQLGRGFTWTKTPEEHRTALKEGWPAAKAAIMSGEYDLIVLDELNNALAIESFPVDDVLPLQDILTTIKTRPPHVHLVITGRSAHPEIKKAADLVSVISAEKHYYDEGIPAVKGIEF